MYTNDPKLLHVEQCAIVRRRAIASMLVIIGLVACPALKARADSRRILIGENSPSSATITLSATDCAANCNCGLTVAFSATVSCQQSDGDFMTTALACEINRQGNPNYRARVPRSGYLDVYFPNGKCLCVTSGGTPVKLSDASCYFASLCGWDFYLAFDASILPIKPPVTDCNFNDVEDATDVGTGSSLDCNGNGVPDECDVWGAMVFDIQGPFPTAAYPLALDRADFNRDGRTEFATAAYFANGQSSVVRTLQPDGTSCINLQGPSNYSVGDSAYSIVAAQLLGDAGPDLAITDFLLSRVAILRNTSSVGGNITFQTPAQTVSPSFAPVFVVSIDVDMDGDNDLAVVDGNGFVPAVIRILRSNGAGTFLADAGSFQVGLRGNHLAVGDFNVDGRPDLVCVDAASAPATVSVLVNNTQPGSASAISFHPAQPILVSTTDPKAVTVADLDCDGRPDLAVSCENFFADNSVVSVLLNSSSLPGSTVQFYAATQPAVGYQGNPIDIDHADFDGDGDFDLVTANKKVNTVSVLFNNGRGTLFRRQDVYAGVTPYGVITPDINVDGRPDIVVADFGGVTEPDLGYVFVIFNRSTPPTVEDCNSDLAPDACICAGVKPGDVNADGKANGVDIQKFLKQLLGAEPASPLCRVDINYSGALTVADVPPFVCILLGYQNCCVLCSSQFHHTSGESGGGWPARIADCNTNGIDDSIDIAQQTSPDCNTNGMPDECEPDCNSNGYPDDCDVADQRSPDCNANGYPDECDFELPFLPSFDCNTNGIPDECDIASAYSSDENANNIPDECEEGGQQMMAGGGGETDAGGTPTPPGQMFDNPAWAEFFEWQFENHEALQALTPEERFYVTLDKLGELGLPAAIPWARVQCSQP